MTKHAPLSSFPLPAPSRVVAVVQAAPRTAVKTTYRLEIANKFVGSRNVGDLWLVRKITIFNDGCVGGRTLFKTENESAAREYLASAHDAPRPGSKA